MALIPSARYAGQVDTGDSGYPLGKAQDEHVEGDNTGTPLEMDWINDLWGFQQALLARGGVTPNGFPDKVGTSNYLDAFAKADWTWLGNHVFAQDPKLTTGKELKYQTSTTRTVMLPLSTGAAQQHADPHVAKRNGLVAVDDPLQSVAFPVKLPSGSVLTNVRVSMGQTAAPTQYMQFWIRRVTPVPAGGASTLVDSASVLATGVGNNVKSVATSLAVDNALSCLEIVVQASDVASVSNPDFIYFIELQFTDPGPRNF